MKSQNGITVPIPSAAGIQESVGIFTFSTSKQLTFIAQY